MCSNSHNGDDRRTAPGENCVPALSERGSTALNRRNMLLAGSLIAASLFALPVRSALAAAPAVTDVETYRDTLARVAQRNRYALIDIRADWCAVCHRIEREILSHAAVLPLLAHVPLIKVDVTAMDNGNRQLLSYLRADGPPTFFVADTGSGREYARTRSVGAFSRHDLIRRLRPFADGS